MPPRTRLGSTANEYDEKEEEKDDDRTSAFLLLLRKFSKKGFYKLLLYLNERGELGYNEALKYAIQSKIVSSRSTVTVILNTLTDLRVVERSVSRERPVRTTYRLTRKGKNVLGALRQIERESES